jgi:hypothetical protein
MTPHIRLADELCGLMEEETASSRGISATLNAERNMRSQRSLPVHESYGPAAEEIGIAEGTRQ